MAEQKKNTLEIVLDSWNEHRIIPDEIKPDLLEEVYDAVRFDKDCDPEMVEVLAEML